MRTKKNVFLARAGKATLNPNLTNPLPSPPPLPPFPP